MVTSIANELIYEQDMSVKFATSVQIINEIKASWDKEEGMSEHQLLDDLAKAEVLIIDELAYDDRITNRIRERSYMLAFPNESIRNYISERNMAELKAAIA